MNLTDEQIEAILIKNSVSKTLLVDKSKVEQTVEDHEKEGWKLYNKIEKDGKTKLTFIK